MTKQICSNPQPPQPRLSCQPPADNTMSSPHILINTYTHHLMSPSYLLYNSSLNTSLFFILYPISRMTLLLTCICNHLVSFYFICHVFHSWGSLESGDTISTRRRLILRDTHLTGIARPRVLTYIVSRPPPLRKLRPSSDEDPGTQDVDSDDSLCHLTPDPRGSLCSPLLTGQPTSIQRANQGACSLTRGINGIVSIVFTRGLDLAPYRAA